MGKFKQFLISEKSPSGDFSEYYDALKLKGLGSFKLIRAAHKKFAKHIFKTEKGSVYYIAPDGKVLRDKYTGVTLSSDEIVFIDAQTVYDIHSHREAYSEGRSSSIYFIGNQIILKYNDQEVKFNIASKLPKIGLHPIEHVRNIYPHIGDKIIEIIK